MSYIAVGAAMTPAEGLAFLNRKVMDVAESQAAKSAAKTGNVQILTNIQNQKTAVGVPLLVAPAADIAASIANGVAPADAVANTPLVVNEAGMLGGSIMPIVLIGVGVGAVVFLGRKLLKKKGRR